MSELDKKDELTIKEVWDVLEFANQLTGGQIYPNILNPMLVNQQMKNITLNPLSTSESTVAQAMADPKNSEIQLQGMSQNFEVTSQLYKRLLSYLGDMLSFDFNYACINAKYSDYSSAKYQKDLDELKKFMYAFDYKKEFGIVVRELLRNEAYFGCTRFDQGDSKGGDKYALQELASSPAYTLITGRSPYCLLFSFNMYFFMQPGTDPNMFPPFFANKFSEFIHGGKRITAYDPSLSLNQRGESVWVYWQDIPVGKDPYGWCFKFNPEIATRVPYFSALFSELVQQPTFRALQKSINMSVASRLITGEVPMLKDAKAEVKDQFALSPNVLGQFLAVVKAGIGEALNATALPLNNVKGIEFKAENELYSSAMRNIAAISGVNSNLIYTNENRTNVTESLLSVGVDEQLMTKLYAQFNSYIEYYVNKRTSKFKFKIEFEGTNNFSNRQQRFDKIMTLSDKGIILPNRIASAIGINPFVFQSELDEARASGFVDNLTPIISAFQMSGKDTESTGRPKTSDSKISESGQQTRGDGSNIEKSVQ